MEPQRTSFQGRTNATTFQIPGVVGQVVALLLIAALAVVGFLIFLPLVIVAGVGLVAFVGVTWLRLKWRQAHAPNGPLDGRHNVRVIDRDA